VHLDVEAPNLTTLTCFQEWFGILFFCIDTRFNLKPLKSPVCKKMVCMNQGLKEIRERESEWVGLMCPAFISACVSREWPGVNACHECTLHSHTHAHVYTQCLQTALMARGRLNVG